MSKPQVQGFKQYLVKGVFVDTEADAQTWAETHGVEIIDIKTSNGVEEIDTGPPNAPRIERRHFVISYLIYNPPKKAG